MATYSTNQHVKGDSKQKSLRAKLNRKITIKENFSRDQTKVIILSKNGNLEETCPIEIVQEKISFENELTHWKSSHLNSNKDDNLFATFYERTLELISNFLRTSDRKPDNSTEYLKYIISESGANELLLDLGRENRKLIFRRLDSLLFKKLPFYQILRDQTVKKIVIENSLRVFHQSKCEIKIKKLNIFNSRLEAQVFNLINNKIHFQTPHNLSEVLSLNDKNLLIEKATVEDNQYFTIRPIHHKATTPLDLMRDKTIATSQGPFIIKYLNNASQGILISGETSSGKTKVLASFLSTIVNSKYVALTGNPDEFRNISKELQHVSRRRLLECENNNELEYLADSLATSGINYYISDNSSPLELSFAYILHVKHGIPSLISITAKTELNAILHFINHSMNILKYNDEREYFIWNIVRAFPMLFSISNNGQNNEGILYNIKSQNNIIKIVPHSLETPEKNSQPNL